MDNVNHPEHYTQGTVECIDAIEAATAGLTGIEAVSTGNAIKYLWRWRRKGGADDLRKAKWYINRLLGEMDRSECRVVTHKTDYAARECFVCHRLSAYPAAKSDGAVCKYCGSGTYAVGWAEPITAIKATCSSCQYANSLAWWPGHRRCHYRGRTVRDGDYCDMYKPPTERE